MKLFSRGNQIKETVLETCSLHQWLIRFQEQLRGHCRLKRQQRRRIHSGPSFARDCFFPAHLQPHQSETKKDLRPFSGKTWQTSTRPLRQEARCGHPRPLRKSFVLALQSTEAEEKEWLIKVTRGFLCAKSYLENFVTSLSSGLVCIRNGSRESGEICD